MWYGSTSMWYGLTSMWYGHTSMWYGRRSMWYSHTSMWYGCTSMWYGRTSMWYGRTSMWYGRTMWVQCDMAYNVGTMWVVIDSCFCFFPFNIFLHIVVYISVTGLFFSILKTLWALFHVLFVRWRQPGWGLDQRNVLRSAYRLVDADVYRTDTSDSLSDGRPSLQQTSACILVEPLLF